MTQDGVTDWFDHLRIYNSVIGMLVSLINNSEPWLLSKK